MNLEQGGQEGSVEVFFVRHAESAANAEGGVKIGGDPPLSDRGIHQAQALAEYFKRMELRIDEIHCSTLGRTRETAAPLVAVYLQRLQSGVIHYDARLREIDRGDWDGLPRAEVYTIDVQRRAEALDMDHRAPNGESMSDAAIRMREWLLETINRSRPGSTRRIIAVTHGIALSALLQRICGFDPKRARLIQIDNTSVTKFRLDPEHGWLLCYLNRTPHLDVGL